MTSRVPCIDCAPCPVCKGTARVTARNGRPAACRCCGGLRRFLLVEPAAAVPPHLDSSSPHVRRTHWGLLRFGDSLSYVARGCDVCGNTGLRDRTPLVEQMLEDEP